jgi:ribosomal protein S18 acetylase RimI-like enzyme
MLIRKAQPGDAAAIAQVHVAVWKTAYRGIIPDKALDSLRASQRQPFWEQVIAGNQLLIVAETRSKIVGFASGGATQSAVPSFDCELYAIYILQTYQGQGLGRSLLSAIARELHAMKYQSMILWVLADGPARDFYEHLGGKIVSEGTYPFHHKSYKTLAYGWPDIQVLST